jgi:hypothetical protein
VSAPRTVTLCGHALSEPGHICAFFDSRDQEYQILSPYYKEGLELGEEVITIVDAAREKEHRSRVEKHGVPAEGVLENCQFRVLTSEETYTKGGRFGAERMYDLLHSALADAKRKGNRVRTSGVMDWATRGHAGTEELMEYESRVNFLVPTYECTLLCVYDVNEISGKMMMEIMQTHPYIIYGGRIRENQYYVPPIERLRQVLLPESLPISQDQPLA